MAHTPTRRRSMAVVALIIVALVSACTRPGQSEGIVLEDRATPGRADTSDRPSSFVSPAETTPLSPPDPPSADSTPATSPDSNDSGAPDGSGSEPPFDMTAAERVALEEIGSGRVLFVEDERDGQYQQFDVHVRDATGTWWEVTVDARTGRVVEVDQEAGGNSVGGVGPVVDEVDARAAARAATGSDGIVSARLDEDDEVWVIRLRDGTRIVVVEVDAVTGSVLEVEAEEPDESD